MDDMDRYYKILGLRSGASQEEVKKSYRDLVKVWHPDRFSHDPRLQQKAQGKLKEINLAYEKLSNQIPLAGSYTQNQRSSQEEQSRQQHRASETQKPRPEQDKQYRSHESEQPYSYTQADKKMSYTFKERLIGVIIGIICLIIIAFIKVGIRSAFRPSGTYMSNRTSMAQNRSEATNPTKPIRSTEKWLIEGKSHFVERNYDLAIEAFSNAIAANKNYADAYLYRGAAYYNKGLMAAGIMDIQTACNMGANEGCNVYDAVIKNRKDRERTIQPAIPMEDIEPSKLATTTEPVMRSAEYWLKEGERHLIDKDYDLAIEAFSNAIATKNYNADAYFHRGRAYFYENLYHEAIEDFNEAISFKENFGDAYLYRGHVFKKKGLMLTALFDFQSACNMGSKEGCASFETLTKYTETH